MQSLSELLRIPSLLYPDRVFVACDGQELTFKAMKDSYVHYVLVPSAGELHGWVSTVGFSRVETSSCFGGRNESVRLTEKGSIGFLLVRSDAIGASLYRHGVRKGDRVALLMDNSAEFCECFFGIQKVGAVFTPLRPLMVRDDLSHLFKDTEPKAMFVDQAFIKRTVEFLQDVPDELKAAVTLIWLPNPRSQLITPADVDAALHKVKAIVCLDDERTFIAANASFLAALDAELAADPILPSDNAMILFTSGTTGRPKGVVTAQSASLSHFNMANFSDPLAYIARGDFDGARALFETRMSTTAGPRPPIGLFDRPLCPLALSTVPINILMNSAACVATLTLMRWPGYLDVPKVLYALRDSKSNVTWLNPGMLVEVVRHPITQSVLPPGSFPDLKLLIVAGAKCSVTLQRQGADYFRCGLLQIYGMTETCGAGTFLTPPDHVDPTAYPPDHIAVKRLNSIGRSPPGVHVKIVNPVSHAVMPANTEGEVWIGGPKVMKEYWHNAAASAAVLVDLTDPVTGTQHRYMRSGDLGYLDDDGYLFLSGRIKDVVNLGDGFCYSCGEVEDAILSEVTGVAEVAVAGVPSNAGDRAYAWILLKSGCNPSDFSLMNVHAKLLARGVISKAKLPHVVEVVTSFPKNDSGKIMKPALIASALKSPL